MRPVLFEIEVCGVDVLSKRRDLLQRPDHARGIGAPYCSSITTITPLLPIIEAAPTAGAALLVAVATSPSRSTAPS